MKVLREKQRAILLWAFVICAVNIGLALLFPAIRDAMGSMMGTVPDSMKNWFGDAETWQTYTGYVGQEIFGQMSLILVIMAILFGGSFLAGYEGKGTLQTLLSRPVSRYMAFWQKYFALVVALVGVSTAFYLGAIVGGWILGEPVAYVVFAQCTFMVFLLSLALGSITYAIGGITGKSGIAGITVGLYTFVAYLLSSLSTAAEIVDKISYASLFRYVSAPDIIANGLNATYIILLIVIALASVFLASFIFARRDLKTQ